MRELSLHILDIIQNSLAASADLIKLSISEKPAANSLIITIEDNGEGMANREQKQVIDPFHTSRNTREVGLGLSLFAETAAQSGGKLELDSRAGVGTEVEAVFEYDHIDRPPLGSIEETITSVIALNPELDLIYNHNFDGEKFCFTTEEIRRKLEGIKINHTKVLRWLNDYLEEGIKDLRKGVE